MQKPYIKAATRRKLYYVGSVGFKRRLPWRRPFTVAIYRVCGAAA